LHIKENDINLILMSDNISKNKSSISTTVNIAALVIITGGIIFAKSIITPLLLAIFLSIIMAQPIIWLNRRKVPQLLAITIVFLLFFAVFIGFGQLVGSSLSSFSQNVPKYEKNLTEIGESISAQLDKEGIHFSFDQMSSILKPSKVLGVTANLLGDLGSVMGNTFTVFFLLLFLLLELDTIPVKATAIFKGSSKSVSYFHEIGDNIRHYLSIKTFTSFITGALIWIFLLILGVDYAIIWGLIAFLFNFIPNIGSIIAAIPAVLFALIQLGFGGAAWTIIIFLSVNMFIGNVVEPRIMGKGMGLSTFVVFVALIFWGFALGVVGMFLSVPLTMAIKIICKQYPNTRWIAIILGTEDDAQDILNEKHDADHK